MMIGIVGGVGPLAGGYLLETITSLTIANVDQDHLPIALLSYPDRISDRTQFLLGKEEVNPGYAIANIILKLQMLGATVIGIPCNTVFAPSIFRLVKLILARNGSHINILNTVDVTIQELQKSYPTGAKVGVLSTTGTYQSRIYSKAIVEAGFHFVEVDISFQHQVVHRLIYDKSFGIKSKSSVDNQDAQYLLQRIEDFYHQQRTDVLILGCTEFSVVQSEMKMSIPFVDSTVSLARSLISATEAMKLKLKDYHPQVL